MSAAATWPTKATPLAGVAGPAVHSLGVLCVVHAAITLALWGAAWGFCAYACMGLAALLCALRLRHIGRDPHSVLLFDPSDGLFRIRGSATPLTLTHAWHGPGWMTLRLRPRDIVVPAIHLVIWKSAVPAPFWSELALRAEAGLSRAIRHQNKENP